MVRGAQLQARASKQGAGLENASLVDSNGGEL